MRAKWGMFKCPSSSPLSPSPPFPVLPHQRLVLSSDCIHTIILHVKKKTHSDSQLSIPRFFFFPPRAPERHVGIRLHFEITRYPISQLTSRRLHSRPTLKHSKFKMICIVHVYGEQHFCNGKDWLWMQRRVSATHFSARVMLPPPTRQHRGLAFSL